MIDFPELPFWLDNILLLDKNYRLLFFASLSIVCHWLYQNNLICLFIYFSVHLKLNSDILQITCHPKSLFLAAADDAGQVKVYSFACWFYMIKYNVLDLKVHIQKISRTFQIKKMVKLYGHSSAIKMNFVYGGRDTIYL